MSNKGAVTRFYNGTTFGKYHFAICSATTGHFVNTETNTPVTSEFPLSFYSMPMANDCLGEIDMANGYVDVDLNELLNALSELGPIGQGQGYAKRQAVPSTVEKPRFVEIVRYCRPCYGIKAGIYLYSEIISNKGVTFYFVLDYEEKVVRFGYSVCKGDNFNKRLGVELAKDMFNSPAGPKLFPMIDGRIGDKGVMHDLYTHYRHLLDLECRRQMKNQFESRFGFL